MNIEPTLGLALLAGFVSFISPCVLPLIPAYIGYMSGQATRSASSPGGHRFATFVHGLFFVLGFTLFFVGFGLLTSAASETLSRIGIDIPTILTRLGGVAVILFGLYVMKVLDPVFRAGLRLTRNLQGNLLGGLLFSLIVILVLYAYFFWVFEDPAWAGLALLLLLAAFQNAARNAQNPADFWHRAIQSLQLALTMDTRRLDAPQSRGGYLGSLGMGVVFAAGWTPCIGPVYASILTLAADAATDSGSLLSAAGLLSAYSLGLGIPFLAAALALNQMSGLMARLKRNMRKVELVSGALLIFIGLLILSGNLERISSNFRSGELGELSVRMEACAAATAEGRIHLGTLPGCVSDGLLRLENPAIFAANKKGAASGQEATAAPIFRADPNFNASAYTVGLEPGMIAPDFESTRLDGEAFALSDLRGNTVTLLNFWATWCGPCRLEMPDFQNVYESLGERGFHVVGVNFLEPPEQIRPFVEEEVPVSFPIVLDESGDINDLYTVRQYPTTYILDGHGVVVARHAGALTGEQVLGILESIESGSTLPDTSSGG